jgi:hypothetical protein
MKPVGIMRLAANRMRPIGFMRLAANRRRALAVASRAWRFWPASV